MPSIRVTFRLESIFHFPIWIYHFDKALIKINIDLSTHENGSVEEPIVLKVLEREQQPSLTREHLGIHFNDWNLVDTSSFHIIKHHLGPRIEALYVMCFTDQFQFLLTLQFVHLKSKWDQDWSATANMISEISQCRDVTGALGTKISLRDELGSSNVKGTWTQL